MAEVVLSGCRGYRRRQPLTVELLYSDQIGGQRTISRIGLIPTNDMCLNRHGTSTGTDHARKACPWLRLKSCSETTTPPSNNAPPKSTNIPARIAASHLIGTTPRQAPRRTPGNRPTPTLIGDRRHKKGDRDGNPYAQ